MRRALLWLKQDLRLDDHPALQAALQADRLLPLYVLDPAMLRPSPFGPRRLGVHRARFLLESLAALDAGLRQHGSRLLVVQGHAELVIPTLVDPLGLDEVPLSELPGNSLLREEELPTPLNDLPSVFNQFRTLMEERPNVFQPRAMTFALPPLPSGAASLMEPLPTLSRLGLGEPLGVPATAFPFSGGEPAALARLRDYLWETQGVLQHQESRNGLIGSEYSSKLSPWLANGSLSPRRVAAELHRLEAQHGRSESTQQLWMELLWREFFRWTLLRYGSALFRADGLKATARAPRNLDERYLRWCNGRTGMPLVDANMRELVMTGWMSSRGRQVVASYLVNDLQQDWRYGAAWFEEHLLDYDPASNWGNWAYLAGVASDPRRARAFNALRQARQYDPDAAYVSLWLPELRGLPVEQRHTPFMLSEPQFAGLGYPRLDPIPENWKPYIPSAA
jgi:deoxyribodipyrimidine photo-lyase